MDKIRTLPIRGISVATDAYSGIPGDSVGDTRQLITSRPKWRFGSEDASRPS